MLFYNTKQVAKFFNKSSRWVTNKIKDGYFKEYTIIGKNIGIPKKEVLRILNEKLKKLKETIKSIKEG